MKRKPRKQRDSKAVWLALVVVGVLYYGLACAPPAYDDGKTPDLWTLHYGGLRDCYCGGKPKVEYVRTGIKITCSKCSRVVVGEDRKALYVWQLGLH